MKGNFCMLKEIICKLKVIIQFMKIEYIIKLEIAMKGIELKYAIWTI